MRHWSTRRALTCTALALSISGVAAAAPERSGWYVGGGIGVGDGRFTDFDGASVSESAVALRGHGGYRINRHFAVEGRILGTTNDSNNDNNQATFVSLSGNGVLLLPLSDVLDIFGSVGYYTGASDVSLFSSRDESGVIYGGGLGVNIGTRRQFTIRVEYEGYDTDVLRDFWSVTTSFQYNFAQGRR